MHNKPREGMFLESSNNEQNPMKKYRSTKSSFLQFPYNLFTSKRNKIEKKQYKLTREKERKKEQYILTREKEERKQPKLTRERKK